MTVVVVGVSRAKNRVDAVDVVNVAVAVVIKSVGAFVDAHAGQPRAAFAGIDPHVGGEILMRVSCSGVDHGHNDGRGRVL